jgi:hypothetical protein
MNKDRIVWLGDLQSGHDGELFITTENGIKHNIVKELMEIGILGKYLGDKTKVKIIIEKA